MICGGVGLVSVLRLGPTWQAGLSLAVGGLLVSLAAIDLETRLLPDSLTWPLMGSGLIHSWVWGTGLKWSLAGFLICGGLLWVVGFVYQRLTKRIGLGGGDPKLAAGLGAWLGPEIGLAAVVWGAGVGAITGLGLMALGRAGLKTALPFGPFLALSGVVWLLIRSPFG
jgi:leader peptidase (prepilin peptidase)/N-methyltransferase